MDGATKVREFLRGIHNSSLQSVKTSILLNKDLKTDLNKAIIEFKDTVTTLDLVVFDKANSNEERKIGATYTHRGNTRGNYRGAHKGRGTHRHVPYNKPYESNRRGGYQGRSDTRHYNNRGRGGRNQSYPKREDDGLLLDQSILDQMNPKQRKAYYEGRNKLRTDDNNNSEIPRQIGAANVETNDEASRLTSASAAFGRHSNPTVASTTRQLGNDKRSQGRVTSTNRRIAATMTSRAATPIFEHKDYDKIGRAELDSRADTTCAGATFIPLEFTGQECDVGGFHDTMTPIRNVPVATCATAYDHIGLQETVILVFHETLYFGYAMEHSLLNPNQIRANGLIVDMCPRQYDQSSLHAIVHTKEDISMPLVMHGCISYLPTRLPTESELKSCRYIDMTNEQIWEPYSDSFQDYERQFSKITAETIENIKSNRQIGATLTSERRSDVDATTVSQRLGISHHLSAATLKCTTQKASRHITEPFTRRVKTRQSALRYPRLNDYLYSDTMFSDVVSKPRQNACAQLFVTSKRYATVYPMRTKGQAGEKLNQFITSTGVPLGLITDGAKEETLGQWDEVRKKFLLTQRITEPHSPWQNKAESEIGAIKSHHRRLMDRKRVPEELWDYGLEYTADLRRFIARPELDYRTPYEVLTGDTSDISDYLNFEFYQWVKVYDPVAFPGTREYLGRWLGPAHNVGQALCYYVLKENGQVIARTTVRELTDVELKDENEIQARAAFDNIINTNIGSFTDDAIHTIANDEPEEPILSPEFPEVVQDAIPEEPPDISHGPDPLLQAEIILARGDHAAVAKVKHRKRNSDGNLVGRKHRIPTLDSRIYVCEFPDGEEIDVSYNTLAEHLFSQCDSEGNQYQIFQENINHRKNKNAVDKSDQMVRNGNRNHKKKTVAGWDLEVEWKDGSTSWLSLKDLKNSNSVDVAEYAKANRIDSEPAFDWWVYDVLRRKDRLIKMARSHRLKTGYKFGLRVPETVEEALEIDRENGNTLWQDAIAKEMQNVYIAFDVRSETQAPPGYRLIPHRIIFEIKMDFTRKARLVAGGHKTDPPAQLTYSSVVSRESVRIGFLIAAMYDLEPLAADIGNAYLNAPTKEKYYIVTGPEFGALEQGKIAIIVRALYGLKSSGAMWRAHFAATLRDLGFTSSLADPDVWMRASTLPGEDKQDYYEYILVYVDDLLVISHRGQELLDLLTDKYQYRFKDIGPPKRYLGAIVGRYDKNGTKTWYLSAKDYLSKKAIPVVEEHYGTLNKIKADTPLPPNYHPEDDKSPFLKDDEISLYQSFIGTLRWAVELGRIDLTFGVSLMSRFSGAPRDDHMQKLLWMFTYIKRHLESKFSSPSWCLTHLHVIGHTINS